MPPLLSQAVQVPSSLSLMPRKSSSAEWDEGSYDQEDLLEEVEPCVESWIKSLWRAPVSFL